VDPSSWACLSHKALSIFQLTQDLHSTRENHAFLHPSRTAAPSALYLLYLSFSLSLTIISLRFLSAVVLPSTTPLPYRTTSHVHLKRFVLSSEKEEIKPTEPTSLVFQFHFEGKSLVRLGRCIPRSPTKWRGPKYMNCIQLSHSLLGCDAV